IRTMHLCEVAADFALSVLKPGGHFLAKTFQGGAENELLSMLKKNFRSVHHVKPPASRDESVELYLLAKDFKGREAGPPSGGSERPVDVPKASSARSHSEGPGDADD
ncbi:23S rRNA methyltransferase, partial [Mesorhizobium sp. M7A.F.Ca.CA.001.07.2.1]